MGRITVHFKLLSDEGKDETEKKTLNFDTKIPGQFFYEGQNNALWIEYRT